MPVFTADICDRHEHDVAVCDPVFAAYGGRPVFEGRIVTLRTFEDNARIAALLRSPGAGKVLVVDGGGSLRRALIGGNLAKDAAGHGWAGVVLNGCIRDRHEIAEVALGVRALAINPRPPRKEGVGAEGQPLRFAGITFNPGDYLYADGDGVLVMKNPVAA